MRPLLGAPMASCWLLAGTVALLAIPPVVSAEPPGVSATATAHALDELANAIAQGRVTLTPTPTLTSTPTFTATPTPTATPSPTETPAPTPTPMPCWQIDEDTGEIVYAEDGAPVPCAATGGGAAQVLADEPSATAMPMPMATPTVSPVPTEVQPVVIYVAVPQPLPPPSAPQNDGELLALRREVEALRTQLTTPAPAPPTYTPEPSPTPTQQPTPQPTATLHAYVFPLEVADENTLSTASAVQDSWPAMEPAETAPPPPPIQPINLPFREALPASGFVDVATARHKVLI